MRMRAGEGPVVASAGFEIVAASENPVDWMRTCSSFGLAMRSTRAETDATVVAGELHLLGRHAEADQRPSSSVHSSIGSEPAGFATVRLYRRAVIARELVLIRSSDELPTSRPTST